MQEINLLQNKVKDKTLRFERSNRLIFILFSIVLVVEIAAAAGLYFLTNTTTSTADKVALENQAIQAILNSNQKDLVMAKGLQAQLINIDTLLKNRMFWSAFLDQISADVPIKIRYYNLSGSAIDNKIHLDGITSSYADVGRLILSLSTSDKYSDVKLSSVSQSTGVAFGYQFAVDFKVAKSIFKKVK